MKRRVKVVGQKVFRKMRLVPVGDQDYEREKRLRHHDPTLSAMADSLFHIDNSRVADGDYTSALAKQNAYIHRLKQHSLQRSRLQSARATLPNESAAATAETLPMLKMPTAYQAKFSRLMAALEKHPGAIARTAADELVIDGVVQRGTSFSDSMRGLYVSSKEPPAGTLQLVRKLAQLRVPSTLLSSKWAIRMYTQGGGSRSRTGAVRALRVY